MKTLPDKPSDLIELGLTELEKCEADPMFKIDMGEFFLVDRASGVCAVCLAGAVMANRLGAIERGLKYAGPGMFEERSKLWFLSGIGTGEILHAALADVSLACPKEIRKERVTTSYQRSPTAFKNESRSLAALLRENNL